MRALALVVVALAACTSAVVPATPTQATAGATGRVEPSVHRPGPAWRRIADVPTPRSEVGAVALNDGIWVVGGFGGGTKVEVLDTSGRGTGGPWLTRPGLPIEVDHAMVAAVAPDAVYVIGGNNGGRATARAFRLSGDQVTEIAAMPGPRSQGAAVAIGTKVYVVGGQADGRLIAPTYVYDALARSWTSAAPILTPRDHLAAVALDGQVCALGGRRLSLADNLASFECYDPVADRWARFPDAPTARGGVGAAVVGRRLFFIGGEQPSGTFKEVEIFDAATSTWSRGPDLPTPRHGLGVVAVGNTVYALTGGPTPGGSQTVVCEALTVP